MKNTEIITYASIAVIVISLFFIGTELTGFAVTANETGVVNVTIATSAALDFTTALFDFGSGTPIAPGATLYSNGTNISGSWSITPGFLVLSNVGNVNVTLNLSANKTVADFIGGDTPTFKALVTENESGSCTTTPTFNTYQDITTTPQTACTTFAFNPNYNTVNIDFELYVPADALGAKTVGIIAIGEYA